MSPFLAKGATLRSGGVSFPTAIAELMLGFKRRIGCLLSAIHNIWLYLSILSGGDTVA